MVFMVVGCAFLMLFGFEIFWLEFLAQWGEEREPEQGFLVFNRRALVFYETFMTTGRPIILDWVFSSNKIRSPPTTVNTFSL